MEKLISVRHKTRSRILLKVGICISAFLVTTYLGISAYAAYSLSQPKRIFNAQAVNIFPFQPEEVQFHPDDNLTIKGWFITSKLSDKALILVHGMNSSRTAEFAGHFAEFGAAMQRQDFTVLMIDLRGHGQTSPARFTFGINERKDVIAAVNWLKTRGFKAGKIGILGVSMGSATAIGATADDPDIGALVTDSGYAEIYPVMQKQWRSVSGLPDIFLPSTMMFANLITGYNVTSSKPVNEINRITPRPVLIIHSSLDPFTPVSNAEQLKAASISSQLWKTSAPEHAGSYSANPKVYVEKVTAFFNQSLK